MSTQVVNPEPVKPLKGKYDGRRNNGPKPHRKLPGESNRKPNWIKQLSARDAYKALHEVDEIVTPSELYRQVYQSKNFSLLWQIRCDIEARAYGKPYTAINPLELNKPASIQDNRLQVYIDKLLPAPNQAKSKRAKRVLAQDAQVVDAVDVPQLPGQVEP